MKARVWLTEHSFDFDERSIRDERPTREELHAWQTQSGLPLKRFFNTSGVLYRSMGLTQRLPTMNEEEQLTLLASDGMLVRRPLLIADNIILVGFREKEWSERLLGQ